MDWVLVLTPFALLLATAVGGSIAWFVRSRYEELRSLEDRLSWDRRKIYRDILEPYIELFASIRDPVVQARVMEKMLSLEYRKTAFELALIASDEVVRAHGDMMQYFYKLDAGGAKPSTDQGILGMRHFGRLELAIRRSLGNKNTTLSEFDMLRWLIRDIERLDKPKGSL